ncbi:uncharacterized protein BP5553_01014 [Venustampulla echinocandica]|uniref:Uncharacterized protein n=1 Tax=Venustampulla echinocandica TaxID=2656787 RepID=A0A370TZT4_9HELO|nr:uncharacterized protein BP5553_01014 [Venustampulla echinocandica]RDL41035.1 hypothetical protein BP5553_01014 [Venustampulla echinocandica]
MILIDAFASLQDRKLEPYSASMEWLQMARGAGSVLSVAIHAIIDDKNAKIMAIIKASPQLDDTKCLFAAENRTPLLATLLSREPPLDKEPWLPETQDAYEQTVSYIGNAQAAISANEHPMGICRRVMAFPLLVPKMFLDFVEQHRP